LKHRTVLYSFFLLLISISILFTTLSAENEKLFRLPFRISEGVDKFKPLTREDVQLLINEQPREIKDLIERETSISMLPDIGRSFILSFNILDYNKKVADGVSYLVTENLNTSDILFLMTPVTVYRFPVSRNKLKMVGDIEKLVKKDIEFYRQRYNARLQDMESQITLLKKAIEDPYTYGIYQPVVDFLKNYPQEVSNYAKMFLLPDISKYQQVLQFLGQREGERWCIHFQDRGMYGGFIRAREVIHELKTTFSHSEYSSPVVNNAISSFEQMMGQYEAIDPAPLLNACYSGEITYNTVFTGTYTRKEGDVSQSFFNFFENIYRQAAIRTGGTCPEIEDITGAVRDIIDHRDHFYQIIYTFDGQVAEKNIRITVNGTNTSPDYKKTYTKEEIETFLYYLTVEKVSISEFSLNARKLSFAITSFKLQDLDKNPFGILRVRIQLHDEWGEKLYLSERILRTSDKKPETQEEGGMEESESPGENKIEVKSRDANKVTIAHDLPPVPKGSYVLNIIVTDFIRNCSTSIARDIELK